MGRAEALIALRQALSTVPDLELLAEPADLQRFSRDAFEYSPVLTPRLEPCRADLVARPRTVEAVERLASACAEHQVPLTLRGSGTGNYGQCVPLQGGVVMLTTSLRQIRSIDAATGVVTVEPGCVMRDLDQELRRHGRQLRLMPSTWRSATIGGFVAGGSGGIGSLRWGFLRDPGHLLGMEVVPLRPDAQRHQIGEVDAEALNHAYGTNGIITALRLATAPVVNWQQVSVDCERWEQAIELMHRVAASALDLHLGPLLEQPLLSRMPSWGGPAVSAHRLLLLVAPDGLTSLQRMVQSAGATLRDLGPEDLSGGNGLRELSWNHTTLHVRASEPGWTYLQMLLPQPEAPAMAALKQRWGDALVWHLELVRQQGCPRLAALPLVRWQGVEQLNRLMDDCRAAGAVLFNPHVITVEDGGLGVIDADQVAAKQRFDPAGLLNPGKLRGWEERS